MLQPTRQRANMDPKNITVLLGEDDDGHALLVQKNLERAGFTGQIVRLRDGREVLDYLDKPPAEQGDPRLLLLDINMPNVGGIEVLQQLRRDPPNARLLVIMLSTTDDPREIVRCYELGCNIYVVKPIVYEQFVDAVMRLGMFLAVVKVPTNVGSRA
ncbi:MAG: response regulator [Planctomycetota bacterium]